MASRRTEKRREPPTYDGGRPYNPPDDFPEYPNDGGFNEWTPVPQPFAGDPDRPRGDTPRMYTAKFKSSSRQAEVFIHDPVAALTGRERSITSPPGLRRLRADIPVTTLVINHHRTLAKHIIRATALVDDDSIGITIHKQERPE